MKYKNLQENDQKFALLVFDGTLLNNNTAFRGFDGNVTLDSKKSYSLALNYWHEKKELIITWFVGDDIYITENGSVTINDVSNEIYVNLNSSILSLTH